MSGIKFRKRVGWEPVRIVDSATLTGGVDNFGAPLDHNCYLIKIVNNSNKEFYLYKNGESKPIDYFPPGSYFLTDDCANKNTDDGLSQDKGTQFQLKGTAGVGTITLTAKYATDGRE